MPRIGQFEKKATAMVYDESDLVLVFGDSFSKVGDATEAPAGFTVSAGVFPGISVHGLEQEAALLPVNTIRNLSWNAANKTLRFGTGEPQQFDRSGIFVIPDVTPNTGVLVSVRVPDLPLVDTVFTVTNSVNRPDVGRTMASVTNWLDTFLSAEFTIVNFSGGGQTLLSAQSAMDWAYSTYSSFAASVVLLAVNDLAQAIGYADPLGEMKRRFEAAIGRAVAAGRPVFAAIAPLNYGTESVAYLELTDKYNAWVIARCRTLADVTVINPWESMINPQPGAATGRVGYVSAADDLHNTPASAQYAGWVIANAIRARGLRGTPVYWGNPRGVASAAHPGGNMIVNPHMYGTAGVSPSGQCADSYTLTNGGVALTALASSKVARPGVAYQWQNQTFSADTDASFFTLAPTKVVGVSPVAGERVQLLTEVQVSGDVMGPDFRLQMVGALGGLSPYLRSMVPDPSLTVAMPITAYTGVISSVPFVWPAGATVGNLMLNGYGRNGSNGASIAFGRTTFRRLV